MRKAKLFAAFYQRREWTLKEIDDSDKVMHLIGWWSPGFKWTFVTTVQNCSPYAILLKHPLVYDVEEQIDRVLMCPEQCDKLLCDNLK